MSAPRRAVRAAAALGVLAAAFLAVPSAAAPAPPTVIAVVEDGLNVYHQDFRAGTTAHPSTYVPGYPRASAPLRVNLRAKDFATARKSDDSLWAGFKHDTLYYVPGTKIVGLVSIPGDPTQRAPELEVSNGTTPERDIIDSSGHGTSVASVAAGRLYGACKRCLLVVVATSDYTSGVAWAAKQPWIDVISNSYGPIGETPTGGSVGGVGVLGRINESTRAAAAAGKVVVFASGNGLTGAGALTGATPDRGLTWHSPFSGPPWVVTVGAASPRNGQPANWHNVPVDVTSYGSAWPSASSVSLTESEEFYGTSCAAPVAAGVIAAAIDSVRAATRHRYAPGLLVNAASRPRSGPLADGRLTRAEVVAATLAVARWVPFDTAGFSRDPLTTPTTDVGYTYQGYGLLDPSSVAPLADVLLGRRAMPARPEMAEWSARATSARSTIWGPSPS